MTKFIALIFIFAMSISISFAREANRCGGVCYGTSNNTFYNSACQGASVNGQAACERYSGLGCVWEARQLVPGKCVGTGGNDFYDSACRAASVNGQKACEKYSGLGCLWEPAYCR